MKRIAVAAIGMTLVSTVAALSAPGTVFASTEEFRVLDCDGSPRAARSVAEGSLSTVEIRVTSKDGATQVSGPSFQLSSSQERSAGPSSFTSSITDGRGAFRDVRAGDWRICPSGDAAGISELTITQVAIINAGETGSDKTAWLGAGGIALSGLGFGVLSGGGSDSAIPASTGEGSGGPSFGEDSPVQPLLPESSFDSAGNTAGKGPGDKIACAAAEDCLKGEKPTPLSPVL